MNAPFTEIINIKPGMMKRVNIKAIVLEMIYKQSKIDIMKDICELKVADETSSCIVTVFDPQIIKLIECSDILEMRNMAVRLFHGQLRLYATNDIQKVGDFTLAFNDKINISEVIHQDPPVTPEEKPQQNASTGTGRTLEVKRMNVGSDYKSPSNKKLEVVRRMNGSSSKSPNSMQQQQQRRFISPLNKLSPSSVMIQKPYSLQKKQEISNSMRQLLELQRTPSSVSFNKPMHSFNQQQQAGGSSPKNVKRVHSPIKSPQVPEASKIRIAHHASSTTSIFRGKDSLESKRSNLKNIFHSPV